MALSQFTAAEVANITNSVIDFHVKGKAKDQTKENRPLLDALEAGKKEFPGGKDLITWPVRGNYTSVTQGFSGDDEVSFSNPTGTKRGSIGWFMEHTGISFTHDEMLRDGVSVTDATGSGKTTQTHTQADVIKLTSIIEEKTYDLMEGRRKSLHEMLWRDGTQDPKHIPGILSFILNDPTAAGSTFGVDRVANTWWRNIASLAIDVSTPSNQNLINSMETKYLQQIRYGGKPNKAFAGSDFIEAYQKELRSKGNYTLSGWKGEQDASMGNLYFKGIAIEYDPMLDTLSRAKYCYMLDMRTIKLRPIEDQWAKNFTPERPPQKFVVYKSIVDVAGLTCDQLNANAVFSIA